MPAVYAIQATKTLEIRDPSGRRADVRPAFGRWLALFAQTLFFKKCRLRHEKDCEEKQ